MAVWRSTPCNTARRVATAMLFAIVALLTACQQTTIYSDSVNIPGERWAAETPAHFSVPITDTTCFCRMALLIRNTANYDFSNLYLTLTMVLPDGRSARDTVNCRLANHDGRWLGKGNGNIKTLDIPYRKEMLFPMSGTYQFYLEHIMRPDTLEGIKSVGIRLEREMME